MTDWDREQARATYNIGHWGGGYFDINTDGHLVAYPRRQVNAGIDLFQLVTDLQRAGLTLPVLVRFTEILHDRVDTLCDAFAQAMQNVDYQARYRAVYPIKVNQQQSVVEEIYRHGQGRVGLEAGSKPELMAVLGTLQGDNNVVVCNGYKDREYIRLALIGTRLGHRVHIVVEKPSELELIIEESSKLGITPILGVRLKLASIGAGKWQNSGGEKSKFGLSAAQLISAMSRLQEVGMQDSLQMLHFHLGSQIANIRDIQRGMRECARYYTELCQMGCDVRIVDVGGGLGIDYEGTRSRSFCSINYSVQEYANNIVQALWEVCEEYDLPHPDIITESGRALTAHHAVLITNVIDIGEVPNPQSMQPPADDEPQILHGLWQSYQALQEDSSERSLVEIYHDVMYGLSEAQTMYTHGVITLLQRAQAEDIYYAASRKLQTLIRTGKRGQGEILDDLNEKLADKYFCNFSLFQSLPDVWAIDQIFPITPLHRLNEKPERRGVLEDITCDSDGRIDHYVDGEGIESSLPLHGYHRNEPYLLGMFLVGAYQEILGDMHNLFGDTDSVNVTLNKDGGYHLTRMVRGDTVDHVLKYVDFDSEKLLAAYRQRIEGMNLEPAQAKLFLQELEAGLHGYTYLED